VHGQDRGQHQAGGDGHQDDQSFPNPAHNLILGRERRL
jgi:hypothetical protein